jgi:hypothetical protein
MDVNTLLGLIAGALMISFALFVAVSKQKALVRAWVFPAAVSGVFLAFSIYAVVSEGPLGFWAEHVRNFWGNQIWFDLLIAASIGWYFMVPKAKEQGMNVLLWMVLIVSSGSIGLTAMLARLLYLREHAQKKRHS